MLQFNTGTLFGAKKNREIVVGSNRKIVFTSKQRDYNYSKQ